MRTRSQARKRRQQQDRQTSVESSNLEKPDNPPPLLLSVLNSTGNTRFTNAKEDLKGILLRRSGLPSKEPKAVNYDAEVTKDTMPPANNGSTKDVQPPVVQIQSRNPNPEPNVAPVVTPIPNRIQFHFHQEEMLNSRNEKANAQIEKFL
ncbi:hypothetical protein Tco_0149451 [Tanacetum coccineum]